MLISLPVREVVVATPRSRIVRLDLGRQRLKYQAGQAVLVGLDGQAERRPYSIASAPEETEARKWVELLIQVDARGTAGPHWLELAPGTFVAVEGPLGSFRFPDRPTEHRFCFIAGGTGIAPLRAMIWHVLLTERRARLCVLYSARAPDEFAYEAELQGLARDGRLTLRQTVTRSTESGWSGDRGRINRGHLAAMIEDPETLCFVCGPRSMVDEVPPLLRQIGVARSRIRLEEW